MKKTNIIFLIMATLFVVAGFLIVSYNEIPDNDYGMKYGVQITPEMNLTDVRIKGSYAPSRSSSRSQSVRVNVAEGKALSGYGIGSIGGPVGLSEQKNIQNSGSVAMSGINGTNVFSEVNNTMSSGVLGGSSLALMAVKGQNSGTGSGGELSANSPIALGTGSAGSSAGKIFAAPSAPFSDYNEGDITHPGGNPTGNPIYDVPVGNGIFFLLFMALGYALILTRKIILKSR